MMKKRLVSLFLTLVMTVSVFPVGALAVEAQKEEKIPATEFPIADISSVIGEQLPTESSFIDKNLSAVPRITMSSEVSEDMPYEAYRNPEAILTEDYGYSAVDAASILDGESEDTKVAYVENEGQLQSAFDSSEVEIVVVRNDFDITSPLNVSIYDGKV